jgi:radical SAM protein with 4Fe4S-binding SPASM domain
MLQGRVIGDSDDDIDDRINVYESGKRGVGGSCYMPTLYYFVRNNGDVNMCFWDWKYSQKFGNLYEDSVEDTLTDRNRMAINQQLTNGNRSAIAVCHACGLPDYRCVREYRNRMVL